MKNMSLRYCASHKKEYTHKIKLFQNKNKNAKKIYSFFFFRVFFPFVIIPEGVTEGQPPLVRPPWGWSTGFIAIPLTDDLNPNFLLIFAFFQLRSQLLILEATPIVAPQFLLIKYCSPDFSWIKILLYILGNLFNIFIN